MTGIGVGVGLLRNYWSYYQGPLDVLSTVPYGAYSVRRLRDRYTGSALQIRRSSDSTTLDVGFDQNGNLDTTAMLAFVGAGNGLVSVWYDQSGNGRNLTQPTAGNQPRLVLSGSLYTENSRPFIRFYGEESATPKRLTLAADMTTVGSVVAVHRMASGGDGFLLGHTGLYYWHSGPPTNLLTGAYASNSVKNGAGYVNGTAASPTAIAWPTTLRTIQVDPQTPGTETTWRYIGDDRGGSHPITMGGGFSELIVTSASFSAIDRSLLNKNQGAYFGITVAP